MTSARALGLALAMLAGATHPGGRDALLARMEARAADRGYPISDPEVANLLAIVARLARPELIVELGTNIGYGAIVLIPREPLEPGKSYTVSIGAGSKTYSWSFRVDTATVAGGR